MDATQIVRYAPKTAGVSRKPSRRRGFDWPRQRADGRRPAAMCPGTPD